MEVLCWTPRETHPKKSYKEANSIDLKDLLLYAKKHPSGDDTLDLSCCVAYALNHREEIWMFLTDFRPTMGGTAILVMDKEAALILTHPLLVASALSLALVSKNLAIFPTARQPRSQHVYPCRSNSKASTAAPHARCPAAHTLGHCV
ncbi:hypothetical protein IQ06DRAFT_98717 [Phaeosphaeriaceae sp. SRC1lsM3a]|nr:hypothetical protein IQ06DRAFT_98717 [Stagonospora sp. SRC1lsM3a]